MKNEETRNDGLPLETFTRWLEEIQQQPPWRARADRECDYYDGNQLDSELLRRQREIGMPPAVEPLIGPTIDAVLGAEAKSRTDWRVTADGEQGGEVAEALNFKLNQAERHSRADDACSAAYASQIKVGLGWVEVARESDPFKYAYRCTPIHRNEIWWDFLAKQPDLSDARYLVRRMWMERRQAELLFPQHAELVRQASSGWQAFDAGSFGTDGGVSTDLAMAWEQERGWSVEEQEWRDMQNSRVCLFEVWYREWVRVLVLKLPDGRVVEYDEGNELHALAVASGQALPQSVVLPRVRLAWWLGPHRLVDMPSPYRHRHFPYVPFWGKREDRTNVPYGLVRGMMYLQDEVNARISKMQWGLAAVRTIRTEGAVLDDDERFRQEVARPDADIVLDAEQMRAGGVFRVERDFELNRQQYERLMDAREGIKRTGGIYNAYMGQDSTAVSGVAIAGLVEQSNQAIADINDNFAYARRQVGELLLAMVIEDGIGRHERVRIAGNGLRADRVIELNAPRLDAETGVRFLDNDVARTRLQVSLQDVPSTPSFRAQQLTALSEAFKSAPPAYQRVMMPHLFGLMDVPNREELLAALQEAERQPTPEEIQQQIDAAVRDALVQTGLELERLRIAQKQPLIDAQVYKTVNEAVSRAVEGMAGAARTAQEVARQPGIAPLAEGVLNEARGQGNGG